MKKYIYILAGLLLMGAASSCADLDLNPPSSASTENWYSNAQEITLSLNDVYRKAFYPFETEFWTDRRTDDWAQRDQVYDFCNGSVKSTTGTYDTDWSNSYKAISRMIRVIDSIEGKLGDDPSLQTLKAEAYFFRAYFYARLTICYGDVPFYIHDIDIDKAFTMGRTEKAVVAEQVYKDFDAAIAGLPYVNTDNKTWRVNKGCAMSLKARYCLNLKDYAECARLCKELMDSNTYSLYYSTENPADSYGELFRQKGMTCENIFSIKTSYAYDPDNTQAIKSWVLRTASGNAVAQPSWDLLAAYECTDGKIINDSPLFDPKNPYLNRDPRCAMTFVVPGTKVYGVVFNPDPTVLTVYDDQTGKEVKNKDTKSNDNYAPYCGTCLRKGAQDEWRNGQYSENPEIIIRYADVLLMYAEAKIEMNDIDNTVLNAINDVRARAYGVQRKDTSKYPAITTTDQTELRKILRRERRVELAWEGRRFFDVRRWGLFEKMYSVHYYGLLNATDLKAQYAKGNWFWPEIPMLDEDGFADFTKMYEAKYIERYGFHVYDPKVELFPIPSDEVIINTNIRQNPGY